MYQNVHCNNSHSAYQHFGMWQVGVGTLKPKMPLSSRLSPFSQILQSCCMTPSDVDLQQYINAVNLINDCVMSDDRSTWWPCVVGHSLKDGSDIIDGQEYKAKLNDTYPDAHRNALLRLVEGGDAVECVLFAYAVKYGIMPVDVVIGFLGDQESALTPAWDGRCVFPMIGVPCGWKPGVPVGSKWIVAAALNRNLRRAVALYGQTRSLRELLDVTPSLAESVRTNVCPCVPGGLGVESQTVAADMCLSNGL